MDELLQKIRDFANAAHGDQTRKYTPDQYIVHPIRVMEICSRFTDNKSILAAALLHDVLEDTCTDKDDIRNFLQTVMTQDAAAETLKMVEELTDVYVKKDYPQWNRRKRKRMEIERMRHISAAAQTIKYADIIDNCREIVSHDPDFARVFLRECNALLKNLDKGNKELYEEAKTLVTQRIGQLENKKQNVE